MDMKTLFYQMEIFKNVSCKSWLRQQRVNFKKFFSNCKNDPRNCSSKAMRSSMFLKLQYFQPHIALKPHATLQSAPPRWRRTIVRAVVPESATVWQKVVTQTSLLMRKRAASAKRELCLTEKNAWIHPNAHALMPTVKCSLQYLPHCYFCMSCFATAKGNAVAMNFVLLLSITCCI